MNITVTVPQIDGDRTDSSYTVTVDRDSAMMSGSSRLGAVMVGRCYYYLAEETGDVYRLTASEIAMVGAGELDERGWDYSLWCASTGHLIEHPRQSVRDALGID